MIKVTCPWCQKVVPIVFSGNRTILLCPECDKGLKVSSTIRVYKWYRKPPGGPTTWKTKRTEN